jgi:hypothetical protein
VARKYNDSIDLSFNELLNATLQNLSEDPSTGLVDGRIWYDTALDAVRVRSNGNTVSLSAGMDAEAIQDIIGAMVTGNTETNITVTYDDTNGKIDFVVGATYAAENAQDDVGGILTDSGRIDFTYDDATPSITADIVTASVANSYLANMTQATIKGRADAAGTGAPVDLTAGQVKTILALTTGDLSDYATATDERAQDAINTSLTAGTHTGGLGFTYNDTSGAISLTLSNNEAFQDIVGAFAASGAGSGGITVTYDDAGNKMNYVVIDDETTQDIIGANVLAHTTAATAGGVVVTYDDASTGRTLISWAMNEAAQDLIGAWLPSGAGSSGITVTYDDAGGKMNYVVGGVATSAITFTNTARIMARYTASGGAAEEATLGADHEFSGGALRLAAWSGGDITKTAAATSATITNSAVTNAKMANMAANTVKMNNTGSAAAPLDVTLANFKTWLALANTDVSGLGSLATVSNLTGPVTSVGAATTITADAVTNAMLANMPTMTVKANNTGGSDNPVDVTVPNFKTMLAYNGSEIAFTPQANIGATNVSAAIAEVVSDLTTLITDTIEARVWKDPVDAATTAALPAVTYGGTATLTATGNGILAAQDGVTLANGDDLLVKDQASTFQNGIYTVTDVGSAGTPFILTRRGDSNSATKLRDATVMVEGGTTQGGDIFTQTTSTLANLTAAAQTWAKTGNSNVVYSADGTTLTLTGSTFSITNAGVTATQLAASVAGNGLTGGAGTALAVGVGTGLTVGADAIGLDRTTNGAKVALIYAADLAGGGTTEDITHNLGSKDVMAIVYLVGGSFAEEDFSVEHLSTTQIRIRSSVTIPASTYRVVVFG